MGGTWYESVATLAYLGGMTSRIELLTHVLVLPYHHPLVLAKSLATVDAMTRGRLLVGVGSGHLKPGVQDPRRALRGARRADRRVHRDPEASCGARIRRSSSGRFFSFRDVVLEPRPHRRPHPPIWVGGNTRRTVRRAVEHGDGWVPWQLELRRAADADRRTDASSQPGAAGRDRGTSWRRFRTIDLLGRRRRRRRGAMSCARAADVAAEIDRYRALGVGRFHVSFVSESCDELLDQLEAFATQVAVLL